MDGGSTETKACAASLDEHRHDAMTLSQTTSPASNIDITWLLLMTSIREICSQEGLGAKAQALSKRTDPSTRGHAKTTVFRARNLRSTSLLHP